jgi:hypothetical protein
MPWWMLLFVVVVDVFSEYVRVHQSWPSHQIDWMLLKEESKNQSCRGGFLKRQINRNQMDGKETSDEYAYRHSSYLI